MQGISKRITRHQMMLNIDLYNLADLVPGWNGRQSSSQT